MATSLSHHTRLYSTSHAESPILHPQSKPTVTKSLCAMIYLQTGLHVYSSCKSIKKKCQERLASRGLLNAIYRSGDHSEGMGLQMESDHLHQTCCPVFKECTFHFLCIKSHSRVARAASLSVLPFLTPALTLSPGYLSRLSSKRRPFELSISFILILMLKKKKKKREIWQVFLW